jgi:hypothetical protein
MHPSRLYTLDSREQVRIEAELNNCNRFSGACELSLDYFIGPRTESTTTFDANQEI